MVPTFTWGLSRSNLAFATLLSLLLFLVFSSAGRRTYPRYKTSVWQGCYAQPSRGYSALRRLLLAHHLFGDVRWHFVIALELHRVSRTPLRVGPQVRRVPEHFGQRDICAHNLGVASLLHPLHLATATVEV